MIDPLHELVRDLRDKGKPSLAWVMRWSSDGRDPVEAAWDSCRNSNYMLWLLQRANADSATMEAIERIIDESYWKSWHIVGNGPVGQLHPGLADGAVAIRKLGIKPPTIIELLALGIAAISPVMNQRKFDDAGVPNNVV